MNMQNYAKIADYIAEQSLAVLATTDEDGSPYGAVVFACTASERPNIYFMTKNGTRKYKNLSARPQVSVTFYNQAQNSTLQAKGRAFVEHDPKVIDIVSKKITRAHAAADEWLPPISKLRAGEYSLVGIELTEARLAEFKGKEIGDPGIFTQM